MSNTKLPAPYGYCPECGAEGVLRERRINGNDKCENGHVYPSARAHTAVADRERQAGEAVALSVDTLNDLWRSTIDSADPTAGNAHIHFARKVLASLPTPQAVQAVGERAELRRLSDCCPELNMSNYGPDDVDELNGWAIEVAQCIDRALAAPSPDGKAEQAEAPSDSTLKLAEMILSDCGHSAAISTLLRDRVAERIERHLATQPTASNAGEALTDAQIDALMPEADGAAEADETPVIVQGVPGYEFTEVAAWSAPLVRQTVRAALASKQPEQVAQDSALREFFALHAAEVEKNPYAYCEVAYTRATGWMAWITDKPLAYVVESPDRKVLMTGQGDTPEEAAANAIEAARARGEGERS